jgi:Ca-activated chloride channel family protein
MSFGLPVLLLLTVALLPVIVALLLYGRWRRLALRRLLGTRGARGAGTLGHRRLLQSALLLSVLLLVAVAAARPQLGTRQVILPREGANVVIALDVSASMLATDIEPNRFEHTKDLLSRFLDGLYGDRVGLVLFAGSAAPRFPLTTDIDAAREVIRSAAIREAGLEPGTAIGEAIRVALEAFPAGQPSRNNILLLVTDGEDFGGGPLEAAALARERSITLYTIGVGTEVGGPIIVPETERSRAQPRTDPTTGGPAVSQRDEPLLLQLAAAGQGRYFDGNVAGTSADLSAEVGRLTRTRFESQEGSLPIERFQWFVAAALLLVVAATVLPNTVRRAAPATAVQAGRRNAHPRLPRRLRAGHTRAITSD